jgi:cob(I)alamin adenosyltransferase
MTVTADRPDDRRRTLSAARKHDIVHRVKVYTRGGDQGSTSLLSGGRVGKNDPRLEAFGTVDELNSVIGLLLSEGLPDEAETMLRGVQESLFAVGSALADARGTHPQDHRAWRAGPLEDWIDAMDAELPELRRFILPGGGRPAAIAHLARTVCRRAERRVLTLGSEPVGLPEGIVPFLNRLSDALFVLARWLNARIGVVDPEWTPKPPG